MKIDGCGFWKGALYGEPHFQIQIPRKVEINIEDTTYGFGIFYYYLIPINCFGIEWVWRPILFALRFYDFRYLWKMYFCARCNVHQFTKERLKRCKGCGTKLSQM